MPDINFRLTATDEASPVIDRARQKMDQFNRSYSGTASTSRSSGPSGSSGGKSGGGTGGFLGSGKIAGMAGLAIIAQAAVQVLQKVYQKLLEASPYLKAVTQQFKTATDIYFRPMGDAIAKMLQPMSERAIEKAEERSELFAKMEADYGPVATVLGTVGFALYDVKAALWEFNYGVWNALSKVYLWPIDKLGELLGVDLPGSLTELLDSVFGIKGGFAGVQEFLEKGLPEKLGQAGEDLKKWFSDGAGNIGESLSDFGTDLKTRFENALSTVGTALGGFGTWVMDKLKSGLDGATSIASKIGGFGTWVYDKLTGALSKLASTIGGIPAQLWNGMRAALQEINIEILGNKISPFDFIPKMASGGIVTKPTLAMIGEAGPEAVVPLKNGMGGMGQGVTININAPVYGVSDLERTFRDMMAREQMGYSSYR